MLSEKILDLNNPISTIITIDISSDSRQSGSQNIAHNIARYLSSVGYENVNIHSIQDKNFSLDTENTSKEHIDACKKVTIDINTCTNPNRK